MKSLDGERPELRTSPFGTLLRTHRLVVGLSQDQLAEKARMSADGISALERGIRRTPQRETVTLLANALGLTGEKRYAFEAAAKQRNSKLSDADPVLFESSGSGSENHNLPLQLSSFIGREHEVQDITASVKANRLVTITGSGGVGKTRTALAVGAELLDWLNDGVWLVELAPLSDAAAMASTLALAVGIQESPDRPLLETLLAHLKNKALVVILDNCDRVVADAAALAESLLRGCPRMRLLVTSRESLRTAGEQVYRLPSLTCPIPRDAARLGASQGAGYAAMVLFAERAHAKDSRFAVSDENAPIVAEICLRLDGIPLAIELAAARIKVFSVRMLLQKLEQRFRILTAGDRTALPRHQTMRALIDWSYDLLTAPEQHLFDCLSLFAGGCTLAAATAVRAAEGERESDTFDILSSLVDKSLVVADVSAPETRYRLLESSRRYASEKLAGRGEQVSESHRRAHARAYLEVAQWLEQAWDTTPDRRWSALAEVEGRGFAVVADEVRKLADRSRTATKNISQILNAMKRDTHLAAETMRASVASMDSSIAISERATRSLETVAAAIGSTTGVAETLAVRAEQMHQDSLHMTGNMTALRLPSRRTPRRLPKCARQRTMLRT